jgi:small subunit ribosomal protein S8
MYRKADELPFVLNDYGIAILSTSHGMMTNKDARKKSIGGEVICSVY